jgi:uncharacterized protein (DUF1800 family)
MDPALSALNRFGLGARIGERARIGDAREWLAAQLTREPASAPPPAGASAGEVGEALRAVRAAAGAGERERREARRRLAAIASAEAGAALTLRVVTGSPFVERLVGFWSNHLCVSAGAKVVVAPLAGAYEREAIRHHVLGRFEEMVLASARHPAMLLYLDNFQSIGPGSPAARLARRPDARRGLNENYARELLELHTLGVDGGYDQEDVVALARILTGWTVGGVGAPRLPGRVGGADAADGPMRFLFRDPLHEPGAKSLLGVRYAEAGVTEGERAIRALCRHPSTARFVAGKLVGHFVSDEPRPAAVARVARIFRETEGDLREVSRELIALPEAWAEGTRKFRTPQDWLVAVLRATGAAEAGAPVIAALRQLRQPLWSPPSPAGYGDATRDWADPDALLNRAELARTLARTLARRLGSRAPEPAALLEVVDVPSGDPLRPLLADRSIPAPERLALALAGPAFQWR